MADNSQSGKLINIEEITFDLSKKSGALVIYCGKHFRGTSICLQYTDFWSDVQQIWANVVERVVNDKQEFIAVFPSLKPRQYQVIATGFKAPGNVTIFANNIAEVDWRDANR